MVICGTGPGMGRPRFSAAEAPVQGKNAFFLKKSCEMHLKTGRSVIYYVYASQQCEAEMLLQERFSDGF